MGMYLIARDNIKKRKGNAFILLLMVALATLLLYVGISVLSNMDKVIENRNKAVNGADYFLATASAYTDEIQSILQNRVETKEWEKEKGNYLPGVKYYKGDQTPKDAQQLDFLFLDKNIPRTMSQIHLLEREKEWNENSIILPYYMKVGMGYKSGDSIHLLYNNKTYDFIIYGFTEDVMFSTPANISVEKCYVSSEYFKRYSDEWGASTTVFRLQLKSTYDAEKFEEDMMQALHAQIPDYQYVPNISLNYETMKYGTGITANIFMAILTAFAILLILISLIIIHFNINNSIESNIKNIGLLEASGYTSRQLGMATLYEFLMIGVCGIAVGLLIANTAAKAIGNLLSASIGMSWQLGFDFISALLSMAITLVLVLLAVLLCVRKYKNITPLDALRNGIHTHNFKRNWIKLEQVNLPLNFSIGLKNIIYYQKKNIVVCLIMIVLCFCATTAVCIYQNFAVQETKLIQVTGFEVPDIMIAVSGGSKDTPTEILERAEEKLESAGEIKNILNYAEYDVICRNKEEEVSVNCDIFDQTRDLTVDNVVEGRRPEYENEIMLSTLMADKLKVSLGDVVYLELNGISKDYLLVGISQGINHLGKKAMLTMDGMKRLDDKLGPGMLYIYLKEEAHINQTIEKIKIILKGESVEVINFQDYVSATMDSITSVMKILCLVLLIAAIFVIAMTLMLLIKTQLVRDRKTIGICKALGYTTRQLIVQTTMSYIPVVFIGSVIGCIAAWFGVNPLFISFLSAFGIKKCSLDLSVLSLVGVVILISFWAECIALLCSVKIRKILPYQMIQEE